MVESRLDICLSLVLLLVDKMVVYFGAQSCDILAEMKCHDFFTLLRIILCSILILIVVLLKIALWMIWMPISCSTSKLIKSKMDTSHTNQCWKSCSSPKRTFFFAVYFEIVQKGLCLWAKSILLCMKSKMGHATCSHTALYWATFIWYNTVYPHNFLSSPYTPTLKPYPHHLCAN